MHLGQFLAHIFGGAKQKIQQAEHTVVAQAPHVAQQAAHALAQTPQGHAVQQVAHFIPGAIMPTVQHVAQAPLHGLVGKAANLIEGTHGTPTVQSVVRNAPIIKQAVDFGKQPEQPLLQGEKSLVKGIAKTGAQNAGYFAPELKLMKGANFAGKVGAKLVNNAVPGALTGALASAASGNKPQQILKDAAVTGGVNAAGSLAGAAAGKVTKAVVKEVKGGFANTLKSQAGSAPIDPLKAIQEGKALTPHDTPAIIAKRAEVAQVKPTHLDTSPERQALRQHVEDTLFNNGGVAHPKDTTPVRQDRQAHIVLGPPASGKSSVLADPIRKEAGARLIDSDEAKAMLGDVNHAAALHVESDGIANKMLQKGVQNGDNLVLPLVGKNPDKIAAIAEQLHTNGYDVHLHYNHVAPDEAMKRAVSRFNETGRFVDPHYVQSIGLKPKDTYDIMKNNEHVKSYQAFNNEVPFGQPATLVERGIPARPDSAGRPQGALDAPGSQSPQAPEIAQNKFTQSVKNSPEVSPEVQSQVSGQHEVRNTKELINKTQQQIQNEGVDHALTRTLEELSVPAGKASDETLSRAMDLAAHYDAIGTPESQDLAARLYDQVSEHGVGHGQGSQILSRLARRSPAGLRNKAFRDLKQAGVELTPELKKEIQGHIDTIRGMKDGPAKDLAIAVMQKSVAKHLPQGKLDNAVSIWKAGLLSGVKTQQGNAISNATFNTARTLSDPISTLADKLLSVGTGKRTKATTLQGKISGGNQGIKSGLGTMKTGIDPRGVGDKYEQHAEINLGNKVLQKVIGAPANFVFRGMNAADQPFFYSTLKNSLYDQAKADGINQGLHGGALQKHMSELVQNPTESMAVTANKEAAKSVLAYDTMASKIVQAAHKGIENSGYPPAVKQVASAVLHGIAPFVRVPTAFLARTIDFTPLGIGKEGFIQAAEGKFDQRALSQAIGEGLTGSGAIVLGTSLARGGILSGDYPTSDPKEAARWKAEGITPNSIKLGNKWLSLNYLGPLGLLFRAGQQIEDARQGGDSAPTQIAKAVGGLGQGLMGQSFLQGFSGLSNAIQDPQRSAKTFLNSQISSVVPNLANDVANLTDSMQRQTNSPLQAVEARIPGVRTSLPVKTDSLGNDLKQASGGGVNTLLGVKPSNSIDNPMFSEVNRLQKTGNLVFPVEDKTIGTGKDAVHLTPAQVTQRSKLVGQALTPLWNQIMQSPGYQNMDDAHKATALQKALTDVNSGVNRQMLAQIDPSKLTKPATQKQLGILNKSATATDYLHAKTSTPKDPKSAYQSALDSFNKNQATMTESKKIASQRHLTELKIKKDYSQEAIDFYNLSNADKNAMFKQDPVKAKQLYDQAKELSGKLSGAGFTSKKVSTATTKSSTGRTRKVATARVIKPPKLTIKKITTPKLKRSYVSLHVKKPTYNKIKAVSSSGKSPKLVA